MPPSPSPVILPKWLLQRLLLAGLVTGLVLGACGSTQFLRSDRRAKPLVVRYTVVRKHFLYFMGLGRDTIETEFRYRKVLQVPPSSCGWNVYLTRSLRLPGPEPRWLMRAECPDDTEESGSVYLLRVPASGPAWLRVGPAPRGPLKYALHWLADNSALWLAGEGETGVLLDLNTMQAAPTWLPALPIGGNNQPVYSLSPDRRILARLYSPDTTSRYRSVYADGDWQKRWSPRAPQLIISEYNIATHSHRNLTLDGVYVHQVELLNSVEWVRPDGQPYTLRLRQPRP